MQTLGALRKQLRALLTARLGLRRPREWQSSHTGHQGCPANNKELLP